MIEWKKKYCFQNNPIIGNLNIEDFGLSENDKNILINKVFQDYAYYFFVYILLHSNVKKIIVYLNRYVWHICNYNHWCN